MPTFNQNRELGVGGRVRECENIKESIKYMCLKHEANGREKVAVWNFNLHICTRHIYSGLPNGITIKWNLCMVKGRNIISFILFQKKTSPLDIFYVNNNKT
jgi:hypothetical protein